MSESQTVMRETELVPGVLGGLGPLATVDFLAKLVAETGAGQDQDHLHVLIDHNPKVPNRHAAINGTAPSVGPELAAKAQRLESAGADFLVMVCNTAHAFTEDIRAAVNIPFLSIIELVVEQLQRYPTCHRIGVMAADGCLHAELYQHALRTAGYEVVLWDQAELDTFMELVYRIKAGQKSDDIRESLLALAGILERRGAEALISGFTEIPLFIDAGDVKSPLLSSTDILVRRTIEYARQDD